MKKLIFLFLLPLLCACGICKQEKASKKKISENYHIDYIPSSDELLGKMFIEANILKKEDNKFTLQILRVLKKGRNTPPLVIGESILAINTSSQDKIKSDNLLKLIIEAPQHLINEENNYWTINKVITK